MSEYALQEARDLAHAAHTFSRLSVQYKREGQALASERMRTKAEQWLWDARMAKMAADRLLQEEEV